MAAKGKPCILMVVAFSAASWLLGWTMGDMHAQQEKPPPGTPQLPDSLTIPDPQVRRATLARLAVEMLDREPNGAGLCPAVAADPVIRANYWAALANTHLFEKDVLTGPMMVYAEAAPHESGGWFLVAHGFNSNRDTVELIFVAVMPDGRMARATLSYDFDMLGASLYIARCTYVSFMPLAEFMSLCTTEDWGISLSRESLPYARMPLPDQAEIAVGIKDSKGQISNFVPLLRDPRGQAGAERRQPETQPAKNAREGP